MLGGRIRLIFECKREASSYLGICNNQFVISTLELLRIFGCLTKRACNSTS